MNMIGYCWKMNYERETCKMFCKKRNSSNMTKSRTRHSSVNGKLNRVEFNCQYPASVNGIHVIYFRS